MSQAQKGEQPGFDVATVILNADAAKVYATAVGMLRKSEVVHIVAEDAAHRTVEFSNGQRSAGITVTDLGTRLSQLLVGSARLPGQDSATNHVVDGVTARLPGDEGDVQPAVSELSVIASVAKRSPSRCVTADEIALRYAPPGKCYNDGSSDASVVSDESRVPSAEYRFRRR